MSYYGAHWRIDGVTAAFIMRGDRNGRYRIVFERESAELPQIESINWAQPSVERLTEAGEFGLPEGYDRGGCTTYLRENGKRSSSFSRLLGTGLRLDSRP